MRLIQSSIARISMLSLYYMGVFCQWLFGESMDGGGDDFGEERFVVDVFDIVHRLGVFIGNSFV